MTPLKGNIALVTGGAQGLGYAIVSALANAGCTVIAADLDAQKVSDAAAKAGNGVVPLQLDVSDEKSVDDALETIRERHGGFDILINNAGTDVTKSVEDVSVEEWVRVVQVNLFGPFFLSKKALPILVERGRGQIVNIASTAAKRTWANASAYHASKWGLLGFSHALHVEARAKGVKVTAVVAGGMQTPFILERFPETDPSVLQPPENVARAIIGVLTLPPESVVPEIMIIPLKETSWP